MSIIKSFVLFFILVSSSAHAVNIGAFRYCQEKVAGSSPDTLHDSFNLYNRAEQFNADFGTTNWSEPGAHYADHCRGTFANGSAKLGDWGWGCEYEGLTVSVDLAAHNSNQKVTEAHVDFFNSGLTVTYECTFRGYVRDTD